jgi:hypothetical protein
MTPATATTALMIATWRTCSRPVRCRSGGFAVAHHEKRRWPKG